MDYYFNYRGKFVHKVRSIAHHCFRAGMYSHTSVKFSCGNSGFVSKDRPAKIYKEPPKNRPLCKRCFPKKEQDDDQTKDQ